MSIVQKLIEKKRQRMEEKSRLLSADPSEEIDAKVAEYRSMLEQQYQQDLEQQLKKVDAYLEVINDLIEEETETEVSETVPDANI